MINVTNGKLVRLLVDDEPFDIRYGKLGDTSAFIAPRDLAFDTRDGSHLASLAGTWLVGVAGLGGMRDHASTIAFAPRLPPRLSLLSFRMLYRGRLRVDVRSHAARYELLEGDALELPRHGERVTVPPGSPQTCRCPDTPRRARAEPPPAENRPGGREA